MTGGFTTDDLGGGFWGADDPRRPRRPHIPVRPTWLCGACGRPWPCPVRCEELKAEPVRTGAQLYLGACYAAAAQDLADGNVEALWRRFVGWLPL